MVSTPPDPSVVSDVPTPSLKVFNRKDDRLDPAAGDVATPSLDLLVRELGVRRAGVNPFLIGD